MSNRTTWRMARQKGIGGSDLAAILGLDRFRGPLDIYREKTEPLPPDEDGRNPDMERGHRLEPIVLSMLSRQVGHLVRRPRGSIQHPEKGWLRGNIDALLFDYEGEDRTVVEVKCPRARTYDAIMAVGIPDGWLVQLQHYLGLTRLKRGLFAVLNADRWELLLVPVEYDGELVSRLQDAATTFWFENVLAKKPPTGPVGVTLPSAPGREAIPLEATELALSTLHDFQQAREAAVEGERLKEIAQERLERLLPGPGRYTLNNSKLTLTLIQGTRFDRETCARELGVDLSKWDRPAKPYRRLTVTDIHGEGA